MTTTISNLPSDLVEEILSRVPLKPMREVRLTCKKWNDISKTQSFMKMHIRKASSYAAAKKGESQMIVTVGCHLYLTSIVVDGDPSFEHKGKLHIFPDEQVKVSQVCHCEGLLLCILEGDPRVLVWNPYLREKRWIQPRYSFSFSNGLDRFNYALGYEDNKDKSCRRCVKLLRFTDYHYHQPEIQTLWCEMYNFDTGLWTTLGFTPHWRIWNHGVSLKGNSYWPAVKRNINHEDDYVFSDSIISFDFTSGMFGQLLPLPFTARCHDVVSLSCVREEKLAVLHKLSYPCELEIWITNKTDFKEVSWSKFLRMETGFGKMDPFITERFFIDEEKKIAMGVNVVYNKSFKFNIIGEAGYFRQLNLLGELGGGNCRPLVCAYVPSLLQIEQPAGGGKTKRQSELEKL